VARPGVGSPDGRRTTLEEDETCREAAYLNFGMQPPACGRG
jgi:hypothetical protein